MSTLSPNARLVADIFAEVAKGNGAPFWEACHDDIVWRTIGTGSWSGEFTGRQAIIDEIFRPLQRALVERSTVSTRIVDGGDVVVVQALGRNLTRDGQRYDNDYAFVIHFRDGKIARYEEYCDTELIARVLAVQRRYDAQPNPLVTIGPLKFDTSSRQLWKGEESIDVTAREWALIECLIRRPGAIVSKAQVEEALYAMGSEVESNTVEVYVSRLRKKLGADAIETVRGLGYRLGG